MEAKRSSERLRRQKEDKNTRELNLLSPNQEPKRSSRRETNPPKWEKKLWIKQPFPDNYVDSSFLKLMKKNVNVKPLKYWSIAGQTCRVTQQISAILLFIQLYTALNGALVIKYWIIVGSTSLLSMACFLVYSLLPTTHTPTNLFSALVSAFLFMGVLLFMTPILRNLTADISTDTIMALTTIMLISNLMFHNYGSHPSAHTMFPDSISINAAMFAAVLLASRLESNEKVSLLMLAAVLLFALFPIFRRAVRISAKKSSNTADAIMALLLIIILISLMAQYAMWQSLYLYLSCCFAITFVCPYVLVSLQSLKEEIRGPWDEANIGTE